MKLSICNASNQRDPSFAGCACFLSQLFAPVEIKWCKGRYRTFAEIEHV